MSMWDGDPVIIEAENRRLQREGRLPDPPSFTCPQCGMKSYHPDDIENSYCGNCHQFIGS